MGDWGLGIGDWGLGIGDYQMYDEIKRKNNVYIDDDKNTDENENEHYLNNSLNEIKDRKKTYSMYVPSTSSKYKI